MRLSLVIPAYNERDNLPVLLEEIHRALDPGKSDYEVLFVDDGSTDGSGETLGEMMRDDPRVRVLTMERNAGQSAALVEGFRAAGGEVIVTLDADLQNDPADIPRLLEALPGRDAVLGIRRRRRDSAVKRLSSLLGNRVRDLALRDGVVDTGCSLRVFRREAALAVPRFNGMHRFFGALLLIEGMSFAQVEVNHRPRLKGKTKYGVFDRLGRTVPDLLAVRWMRSRVFRARAREEERA